MPWFLGLCTAAWLGFTWLLWGRVTHLVVVPCALVGAAMLATLVYQALERIKHGEVELVVPSPARPGEKLVGVLRAERAFNNLSTLKVTLRCVRSSYRTDFNRGRQETPLPDLESVWSKEARFPVANGECRIEFAIPAGAEATRALWLAGADRMHLNEWFKPGIHWHVEVRGEGPGLAVNRDLPVEIAAPSAGKIAA